MIKTDLANGRASPVSESSVRPGKKGASFTLTLALTLMLMLTLACLHILWARKLSVFSINPISVTKDLRQAYLAVLACKQPSVHIREQR